MKPILYNSTEKQFTTNGIGTLADAISCIVIEERNGSYELEMEYPLGGVHYEEIKNNNIVLAVPSDGKQAQPFRIYKITRPIGGVVSVYAEHISYDLSGIPVRPFRASDCASALRGLVENSMIANPFEVWTDISGSGKYEQKLPASFRSRLAGTQGSILDSFGNGAELEFDRYTVKVHLNRGRDNGVTIRYGKNLTDLKQDESIESVYTATIAYWTKEENDKEEVVIGEIQYLPNHADYPKERVFVLDCSSDFENKPTKEQLNNKAMQYIRSNNLGIPKVSIDVSFIQLWQTEEYKKIVSLERVSLCDTVHVVFEKLGVNATAKVIKTEYNVLTDRYDKVTLGEARSNFAETIKESTKATVQPMIKSAVENAVEHATANISGFSGYVTKITDANGNWSELVISDNADYAQARNVWRWTQGGLGFSRNGYAGPYETAITADGHINGAMITAGTINANMINIGNRTLTETLSKIENNTTNAVKELKLYYALFDFGKTPQKDDPTWKTTKPKRPPFLEDLWYMQAYVLQDGTEVRLDPTKNLEKTLDFYIAGQERDREEAIKKAAELDKKIDSSLKLINENKSLINQTNNSISSIVESKTKILNDKQENIKSKGEELEKEVSKLQAELKITSNAINQRVEQDNFDGFKKQMESMLDINGLHVGESGKGKSNINSDGLIVTDANNEIIAKFTNDDSRVNFLNVREHLSVGSHRFEMFNDDLEITSFSNGEINTTSLDGTAIYWIGDVK